jgi:drug/metabolite transporter (DMT)-like permease
MSDTVRVAQRTSFAATPAAAYLLLVIAMLSWSGNLVIGRALSEAVPALSLSWVRWTVALVVALPFTLRELVAKRHVIRREWRIILTLSLLGLALSNALAYWGLQSTTAINAGLINSVGPVLILLATAMVFRERVALRQIIGILCSLAGVAVIVLRGTPATLATLELNRGDLLMLGAVAVWSIYSLLIRYRPKELSPLALLTVLFAVGSIALLPFHLAAAAHRPIEFEPATIVGLLYLGIFPGVVSILCWNRGVAQIGANRASIFTHLMPLFSAFLAVIFLGERLETFHFIGAAFIFTGIVLAAITSPRHK